MCPHDSAEASWKYWIIWEVYFKLLCKAFEDTSILLLHNGAAKHIPTNTVEKLSFRCISTSMLSFCQQHPNRWDVVTILICIFLMISKTESLHFGYLLTIPLSSLEKCLFSTFVFLYMNVFIYLTDLLHSVPLV